MKRKETSWRVALLAGAPVLTLLLVAVLEAVAIAPPGATRRLAELLLVALGAPLDVVKLYV